MRVYGGIAAKLSHLQWPFPLAIRLYRGRQFAQTGWGKMHNIAKIAGFFASLNIPFPAFSTHFISGLEFFGGLLLILGMASRLTGVFPGLRRRRQERRGRQSNLPPAYSQPGKNPSGETPSPGSAASPRKTPTRR